MDIKRQGSLLNAEFSSESDVLRMVRQGLPATSILGFSAAGYDLQSIVSVVGPRTTIQRKINAKTNLAPDESDRLVRLSRIVTLAEETFGDKEKAQKWLERPSKTLGDGEPPMKLLDTDQGAEMVENRLMQIAHGMFA
ncbi:type II RES/Xre toxin-antitoxin system antitoxin [Xanthomonas hortorum]|uniref:type II RES/Xre toxin-antitoxin system antitoxin n=1 Tax=Xanthomonas hortorum TaxID=56454 RepID=UPI001F2DBC50|nr:antitoxin Xre/MbcA/ParS toxin-binding domain-containing protein [Xanthomonas hortorum]MCE4341660.1 DUF2384 domain-containing protein [Xanthomonas hortorum pv. vitians]